MRTHLGISNSVSPFDVVAIYLFSDGSLTLSFTDKLRIMDGVSIREIEPDDMTQVIAAIENGIQTICDAPTIADGVTQLIG